MPSSPCRTASPGTWTAITQWGEKTDPIDFYAEVNVGRIPWSDPATVSHICTKTRLFELNTNQAYKRNILLLGAFFWPSTDNARLMEYIVRGDLHPWMWNWSKYRMYEQGHSNFAMDEDLRHSNVMAAWSSGSYAFVNWAGHGSPFASYIYYNTVEAFVDTTTSTMLNDESSVRHLRRCLQQFGYGLRQHRADDDEAGSRRLPGGHQAGLRLSGLAEAVPRIQPIPGLLLHDLGHVGVSHAGRLASGGAPQDVRGRAFLLRQVRDVRMGGALRQSGSDSGWARSAHGGCV